jgi:hypothetical protein
VFLDPATCQHFTAVTAHTRASSCR